MEENFNSCNSATSILQKEAKTLVFAIKRQLFRSEELGQTEQSGAVGAFDENQMIGNRVAEQFVLHGFDVGEGAHFDGRG